MSMQKRSSIGLSNTMKTHDLDSVCSSPKRSTLQLHVSSSSLMHGIFDSKRRSEERGSSIIDDVDRLSGKFAGQVEKNL